MRFTVLSGGKYRRQRCVVLSAETLLNALGRGPAKPGVSHGCPALVARLSRLADKGIQTVALAHAADQCDPALSCIRRPPAPSLRVVARSSSDSPNDDLSDAIQFIYCPEESYAAGLAQWCIDRGWAFGAMVGIAGSPKDTDFSLECGCMLALRGSGYKAVSAADAVFPSLDDGGLEAAVEWIEMRFCANDPVDRD